MIDTNLKETIEQIFQSNISRGIKKLNVNKICEFLSNNLGVKVDKDSFIGILDDISIPADINGDIITLTEPTDNENEMLDDTQPEEIGDDVHDKAVDQAAKDMFECKHLFNSVTDIYSRLKPNTRIESKLVKIVEETSPEYIIDKTVKKMKYNYIFESFKIMNKDGKVDLNNSKLKCLIESTKLKIELPITSLIRSRK